MTEAELEQGSVYPSLGRLREVSIAIAAAVSENMFHSDRATQPLPLSRAESGRGGDRALLAACCRASMYTPCYESVDQEAAPLYISSRL